MWKKVAEPVFRDKDVPPGNQPLDSKIRGFGGLTTADVGAVRVDLQHSVFWVWFQDAGWQSIGFAPRKLVDFDAFLHVQNGVPRLKFWIAEWPEATGGLPKTTILDSGWAYE